MPVLSRCAERVTSTSLAVGVGHRGDPEDEDSFSFVGSSDVRGRNLQWARSVAKSVQVGPHLAQISLFTTRDVLDDDCMGPDLLNHSTHLKPESRTWIFEPAAFAGAAVALARKASAEDVYKRQYFSGCEPHIVHISVRSRPVFGKDLSTERVDFHLPYQFWLKSTLSKCLLKTLFQATNARE